MRQQTMNPAVLMFVIVLLSFGPGCKDTTQNPPDEPAVEEQTNPNAPNANELITLQRVMGASRPTDSQANPYYHPFADDNTASGHTFIAAIPLLNLAHMAGGPFQRWAARLASIPTGWSRLNDRKHYLSQVLLGYYLAWHAVDTVNRDAD